ncbi:MAG: DUF1566 domain-containing protein [Spirochaetota bacterium]
MKHLLLFIVTFTLITCNHKSNSDLSLEYQNLEGSDEKCIVIYNANGAYGTPPFDTQVYNVNDTVTILQNQNLHKEGHYFIGWSMCPESSPPILKPGYTFTITASTMLWACFTTQAYTVIYLPGDADGGTTPIDNNYYCPGENANILGNTGNLYKQGYRFHSWFNASTQSHYFPSQLITIQNCNIELIAQFIPKPFTATYHANGATTGTVPVDTMFYEQGELVTIAHNTGNLAIINRDGVSYCFDYWGDSSGNIYLPGNTYPIEQSLILYAHYRPFVLGDIGPCGGCVFYDKGYYSDGWRYLEAMRYDLRSTGIVWEQQLQAGQYRETGATASDIGTGFTNTCTIIQVLGEADYAAYACATSFDGWYLPSKDELQQLFQYKSMIGNFTSYNYWSSTESTTSKAWCQNFNSGTQSTQYKNSAYRVRAIRQF